MPARLLLLLLIAFAAACGTGGGSEPPLPTGSEPVELDPADFSSTIDHPYWPMKPGSTWVYREGANRVEITVADRTREIMGIEARVVHDVVTEDGKLVEDTLDWYAQDRWGNVWYLGEATTEYEQGKPPSTAGSWEAGVDGAQPGILLPAKPEPGMAYRQEYYEGEAEDRARIISVEQQASVPFGSFDHVVLTEDMTPLEPGLVERKYFAQGVGPVLAVTVAGGSGREELVSFETR